MLIATEKLIIRADASTQIGTGHVMRCLALSQAWQDAGRRAVFSMAMEAPALELRLRSEGVEVSHLVVQPGSVDDAIQTADLARKLNATWIVVDGYHFDAEYQRVIKNAGLSLLFVDDNAHSNHYCADIVLNQNTHARPDLYMHKESYTKLLLGTRYVLLRHEFSKKQEWKRKIPEVARKVLVTLGGADPDNVTLRVIHALQQVKVSGLEVVVVIGGTNPHSKELQSSIHNSPLTIRLEHNVTDMAELMAWADVAISSASTTAWELVFMGLPSLVLVLADNQCSVAEWLDENKVAVNLGGHWDVSKIEIAQSVKQVLLSMEQRSAMSRCSQELVDGEGANRVLMFVKGEKLRLRRVRRDDCKLLWTWANDAGVRATSFSSNPIHWKEHLQWFARKFHHADCLIFIALDEHDTPVGQVRFDVMNNADVEIGVSIERGKRGLGYGDLLIRMGVEQVFRSTSRQVIHAFIKPCNQTSIKAFEKAGFKEYNLETVRGNVAMHYVRSSGDDS